MLKTELLIIFMETDTFFQNYLMNRKVKRTAFIFKNYFL